MSIAIPDLNSTVVVVGLQAADAAPDDGLAAVINSQNKTPRINKIGAGSIILPFTSSNWNLV